jgi:hypothetical protein
MFALLVAVSGCGSSKVSIETADLSGPDRAACAALVDALPKTLADELRRPIDPDNAPGAAWGDPAYVLTCGVSKPSSFTDISTCDIANGVAWFADPDEAAHSAADVTITVVDRAPAVSLVVPGRYRPEGVAAALVELARPIKRTLTKIDACG